MNIKFIISSSLLLLSSLSMAQAPNNQIFSGDHLAVCTFPCGAAQFQNALSQLNSPSSEYAFGYIVNTRTEQIKFFEVTRTIIDPFLDPFADPGFIGETSVSVNELPGNSAVVNEVQFVIDAANQFQDLVIARATSSLQIDSATELFSGGPGGPGEANIAVLEALLLNDTLIRAQLVQFIFQADSARLFRELVETSPAMTLTFPDGTRVDFKLNINGDLIMIDVLENTARFSNGESIPRTPNSVPGSVGQSGGGLNPNEAANAGNLLESFGFNFSPNGGSCSESVIATTCIGEGSNQVCESVNICT